MSQNRLLSFGIMAFGLVVLLLSRDLPNTVLDASIGPDFFPKVWGTALCILGMLLFISTVFFPNPKDLEKKTLSPQAKASRKKVAQIFGLTFLYFATMYWLGFVISSIAYIVVCIITIGGTDRKLVIAAVITSLVLTLGLYAFFFYGLGTFLPSPAWS